MKKDDDIRKNLSEKFKDFEAEPQDNSWGNIRFALDLKDKLGSYEAEPQPETWNEIKLVSELGEKFRNFEAEPQEDSFARILAARQLNEKFSNYEAEPQPETWGKIKAAISKDKERRIIYWPFIYRVGIAASIALLLGFGWLLYNKEKISGIAINKPQQKTDNQAIKQDKTINTNTTQSKNADKTTDFDRSKGNGSATNGVLSDDKIASTNAKNISKTKTPKKNFSKRVFEDETLANNQEKTTNEINTQKPETENSIAENKENSATENTKELALELLDSKTFKEKNIRFPFGVIAYNNELPMEEKAEKVRRKMIVTTSLMPLQTYQALTILPQTTSYIQQVGTLNALDAQRLGIQARVGLMKPLSNRFSTGASLAYSGIRQAVSYEVNNGTYDVQITNNQSYTLVGVGEAVSQNKFLHTVGLKLDNSYLLSNKKNKIFVLGGAEAVRVLNNKNEFAYYLNASVALSYPTKNGKSIWIEPTYRYSLSQSLDAFSYMQIRPSNIGLNVRMNFM